MAPRADAGLAPRATELPEVSLAHREAREADPASAPPDPDPPADLLDDPVAFARERPRSSGGAVEELGPNRWSTPFERPDARPEHRPLRAERPPEELLTPVASRLDHTPYRSRFGERKRVALEMHGGSQETELAVAEGLAYLARRQDPEGYWGDPEFYHSKYGYTLVGKTALSLLAFLGAGHTPVSGTEHSEVADRAVGFLLAVQDEASGHFGYTTSYSHGIATYALAECFALTGEERLRAPVERGLRQILDHQVPRRRNDPRSGGWSYYYPDDRTFDEWPRVSITAWQVMALESARLGGIAVPERAFEDARSFLLGSWDARRGFTRYSHDPSRLRSGYPTLPASTPAGLFALTLLGEEASDPRFEGMVEFTISRVPRTYRMQSEDAFVSQGSGNLYFWYYGSLALMRCGGSSWRLWNEAMKEVLLESQEDNGSWRPRSVYSRDYAGDTDSDRVYSTAMCVLILEVYYRYFTPLLEAR